MTLLLVSLVIHFLVVKTKNRSCKSVLHDSDLVLLDEPTSNLDSLNEAVILKSIAKERNDKTVVLVSHRQSTMRIADRTYSVERGRVS